MISNLQYREVQLSDIPALTRIRAYGGDTEEYWTWRIEGYLKHKLHPHEALMPRIIYVAVDGDVIVGFIAGHLTKRFGYKGELQWIDVLPAYRRNGIASRMLTMLAKWFIEQNALRVCVNVGSDEGRQFYFNHNAAEMNKHWMSWQDINLVLKDRSTI